MSEVFERPLFHGTISLITAIDISKGRIRKDFGQGFYMATTPAQAIGMMHKKRREAERRSRGALPPDCDERLYRVTLKPTIAEELRVKVFESADMEWLDFVLAGRAGMRHGYDIVAGPTADDDTAAALQLYTRGLFGPVGSVRAKETLLMSLEPENLGVQVCICNQAAVAKAVDSFELVDWRRY